MGQKMVQSGILSIIGLLLLQIVVKGVIKKMMSVFYMIQLLMLFPLALDVVFPSNASYICQHLLDALELKALEPIKT